MVLTSEIELAAGETGRAKEKTIDCKGWSVAISERLKAMIGNELPSLTQTTRIERKLVENFIWATEDPNSMWRGEEYAGKARKYGEVMAPPSIIWTAGISYKGHLMAPLPDLPSGGVDTGGECEVFKPIKVGDVITAKTRLGDVYERESKGRKMIVLTMDTTYTNQNGEVVGTYKHTMFRF